MPSSRRAPEHWIKAHCKPGRDVGLAESGFDLPADHDFCWQIGYGTLSI